MKSLRIIVSTVLSVVIILSLLIPAYATETEANQFTQENAKKAIIVAFTNYCAEDVFSKDGNSYDVSKYHGYDYNGPYKQKVTKDGTWSQLDATKWHVENLYLELKGFDHATKLTCDVSFDGDNYTISSVSFVTAKSDYIDSKDSSKTSGIQTIDDNDFYSMMVVPADFVTGSGGENNSDSTKDITYSRSYGNSKDYVNWVMGYFSWWDCSCKKLNNMIKSRLNDEKSFKHKETQFICATTENEVERLNGILKDAGYSERLQLNDVFIYTKFTAKNVFNATIKQTAIAILSYSEDSIKIVDIG